MTVHSSTERSEGAAGRPAALASIRTLLAEGAYRAALDACEHLRSEGFDRPVVFRLQGRAHEALGDYAAALAIAKGVVERRPRNVRARLRLAHCLWRCGEIDQALAMADAVAESAAGHPGALLRVGAFYAGAGRLEAAYAAQLRALDLMPEDPAALTAVAESATALGHTAIAERYFDRTLFHDPTQRAVLERRSRLRQRGIEDHQCLQLGYALDALERDDPRRAPVAYALARQLEDLGHHEAAFDIWSEGARGRLLALPAKPTWDHHAMAMVQTVFDGPWLTQHQTSAAGQGRVFLTGLPGSGLERAAGLLSRWDRCAVSQEAGLFADAVTRLVGPMEDPVDRMTEAAGIDPESLRAAYENAANQLAGDASLHVDGSVTHIWMLGLVRRALPGAKIIHLRRDPLDHCFELFTTLFPKGNAWSYDLDALGRHYAGYHQLMGHWRRHLTGGFLDLDYETLFEAPDAAAEQLRAFIEQPKAEFPEAFSDVDMDTEMPVHGPGIGRWRQHERALEPLIVQLAEAGIPVR
ncbi:MAG: sulfotransferase [Pseudomonadota bacterium]